MKKTNKISRPRRGPADPKKGAVLLIAILVSSVALAVGFGVYNRTYKELLFASFWKQTQTAFSAADAGLECAIYWDMHPLATASCFGSSFSWSPVNPGTWSPSPDLAVGAGCARITITKSSGGPHPLSPMNPATTTAGLGSGPYAPIVSPDGTSVYVATWAGNLRQYSRATSTGLLTALAPASVITSGGGTANGVTVSPDSTSVYVVDVTNNDISQYTRATSTGLLSPMSTPTIATGIAPHGIATSPDGKSVYVTNNGALYISQYSRDTTTGLLSPLSTPTIATGAKADGIIVSPDGKSVYAQSSFPSGDIYQYNRDTTTGLLSPMSTQTIPGGRYGDLAISSDGKSLYATNFYGSLDEYSRSTITGQLISIGSAPTVSYPEAVTIFPDGSSVYVVSGGFGPNNPNVSQFDRDIATGLLTAMSPDATLDSGTDPYGITISPDGKSVYVANTSDDTISQFNVSSAGVTTLIESRGYNDACGSTNPRRVERGLKVSY